MGADELGFRLLFWEGFARCRRRLGYVLATSNDALGEITRRRGRRSASPAPGAR